MLEIAVADTIESFLRDAGAPVRRKLHAPARTAWRRAKYLGEPGRLVVKPILLLTERDEGPRPVVRPALVLIAADRHLDIRRAGRALVVDRLAPAPASLLRRLFPGAEAGVVPGFGRCFGVETVIDKQLLDQPYLFFPSLLRAVDLVLPPAAYLAAESPLIASISLPMGVALRLYRGPDETPAAPPSTASATDN